MKKLVAIALFAAALPSYSEPADDLVRQLSFCDARFFKTLADRKAELSVLAAMDVERGHGYFKVPDQRHPTSSRVMFKAPLVVSGLDLIGYFDEIVNIPDQGIIYSWGFLVSSNIKKTAASLRALTWDAARLRDEGEAYVRSEVWTHARKEQGWAKVKTEPGIPKPNTVERVLLVEQYDGETAFVRYGCSLQGSVSTEMLRELRPDLGQ